MEEVDNVPQSLQDQLVKQRSVPAGGRGAGSERERQLSEDNSKLKIRVAILVKVGHRLPHTHTGTGADQHCNARVGSFVAQLSKLKAWLSQLNSFVFLSSMMMCPLSLWLN